MPGSGDDESERDTADDNGRREHERDDPASVATSERCQQHGNRAHARPKVERPERRGCCRYREQEGNEGRRERKDHGGDECDTAEAEAGMRDGKPSGTDAAKRNRSASRARQGAGAKPRKRKR